LEEGMESIGTCKAGASGVTMFIAASVGAKVNIKSAQRRKL
jgi:hypothetical protein